MSQLSPALALATPASPGDLITWDSVGRQTRNSGGLVDIVTAFAGKDEITDSSSATITCIANSTIRVNAWRATAQAIQLPAWSPNHPPILIRTNNYAVKTIQRNGTDTINNPWNYSAAPTGTTYNLYLPGETVRLVPNKLVNFWEVEPVQTPVNLYRCEASLSADQNLGTSTFDRINLNTEVYDFGSFYDNVTNFRATPLIPGLYGVWGSYTIRNATTTEVQGSWRKNTTRVKVIGQENLTGVQTSQQSGSFEILMNGTTDYIEMRAYCGTASGIAFGGASDINTMGVRLISRI
jgi:hypothetical protein